MTIYSILAKFSKSRTSFGPFWGHKTMIKASAEIPLQPPCAPFSTDGCWWLAMNRTKCCLSAASCNFAPLTHWRLPLVHYDALWSTMVCSVLCSPKCKNKIGVQLVQCTGSNFQWQSTFLLCTIWRSLLFLCEEFKRQCGMSLLVSFSISSLQYMQYASNHSRAHVLWLLLQLRGSNRNACPRCRCPLRHRWPPKLISR